MFGIGIGEIILVILITFLVAPRQVPRVLRKIGEFFGALRKIRDEIAEIGDDVRDVIGDDIPLRTRGRRRVVPRGGAKTPLRPTEIKRTEEARHE